MAESAADRPFRASPAYRRIADDVRRDVGLAADRPMTVEQGERIVALLAEQIDRQAALIDLLQRQLSNGGGR